MARLTNYRCVLAPQRTDMMLFLEDAPYSFLHIITDAEQGTVFTAGSKSDGENFCLAYPEDPECLAEIRKIFMTLRIGMYDDLPDTVRVSLLNAEVQAASL